MAKKATREHIVQTADDLFYRQGFEHTSFSHIASEVGISRGNFYHHFKSKDEILSAVISRRLGKTRRMLEDWDGQNDGPVGRITAFIHILIRNQTKIQRYGCPVGSLCSELGKLDHVDRHQANKVFTLFRNWLRVQFEELGQGSESDNLAMHLLARSQGVATLAQAFREEAFIQSEVESMDDWIQQFR